MWQKEGTALLPAAAPGGPGGGGGAANGGGPAAAAGPGGMDMVAVHRQLYLLHFLVDGLGERGGTGVLVRAGGWPACAHATGVG
jgi:hypothetical protein